jgi:hypothetical protein
MPHRTSYERLELQHTDIENCTQGAKYCLQALNGKRRSAYIFQRNQKFTNVNIEEYCLDKGIGACVLKLKSTFSNYVFWPCIEPHLGTFLNF